LQELGKINKKNVIEQIQLIIIISGTDEPVDRRTFSQIVESNWTQAPTFPFPLILARYLYFITATAETQLHTNEKSQIELKFSELSHLGVDIHLLLTSKVQFLPCE
jgi:hypothetical protein